MATLIPDWVHLTEKSLDKNPLRIREKKSECVVRCPNCRQRWANLEFRSQVDGKGHFLCIICGCEFSFPGDHFEGEYLF